MVFLSFFYYSRSFSHAYFQANPQKRDLQYILTDVIISRNIIESELNLHSHTGQYCFICDFAFKRLLFSLYYSSFKLFSMNSSLLFQLIWNIQLSFS